MQFSSDHKDAKTKVNNLYPKRLILGHFLVFFILLIFIFLSASLPVYLQYKKGLEEQLIAQEETSVVSAKQMIQKEMYEQLHIFDMLVKSNILNDYLNEGTREQRDRLEDFFQSISTSFHRFDQIRLLSNSGQEKIRINLVDGEGLLVPDDQLQNKTQRYYFKAAQQLPAGQIFVSAMDLNIEHGVIETPYKPTLRFSTQVYDDQGKAKGILVMNYLAKGMLERFRYLMTQRIDQQGMLLDSQGYWLSNHKRSNEWGADLGKPNHKFASFYPNAWPNIEASKSGTFETDQGLFRFVSIEPLNFVDYQPAHFRMEHQPLISKESLANTDWKMVIFIPRELINSYSFLYQPLGHALIVLLVLILPTIAFLSASFSVQRKMSRLKDKQLVEVLTHQANFDALTGINNRRAFFELGEKELKQAQRHHLPLAALMLDADHFKKVNDTHGHAVGDLVLIDLAQTLANTLREVDLLGRVGGEEFAILLPHTPLAQAQEVAERLRQALAARKIPLPNGTNLSFTASIGLVMLTPEEQDLDKLFHKADLALYQAKKQGRNCVATYQEESDQEESDQKES